MAAPVRARAIRTTRRASDQGHNRDVDRDAFGGMYDGTVGWENEDAHFQNEESPSDRLRDITLIRVTLFEGRRAETDGDLPQDGLALGIKILARPNGAMDSVPPKGTMVHVSIPARRILVPGAGIIVAEARPQLISPADGERVIWAPTGYGGVRFAPNGIFFFTSTDGTKDGKLVSLGITSKGFTMDYPFGRWRFDETGHHVTTNAGAELHLGAIGGLPAPLDAMGSMAKLCGSIMQLEGSAISMGTSAGAPEAWAKATTTLTVLSLISAAFTADASVAGLLATALTNMEADIAALGTALGMIPPSFPTSATAVTAATAALTAYSVPVTAVAAGVSAAAVTLPSASTQGT